MSAPDGSLGKTLQDNCYNLHAIVVDETSLIGSTTLGWMEFHSRCGTGISDKSWGGIPVVVFLGDDVQLPPVLDLPVYITPKNKSPASSLERFKYSCFFKNNNSTRRARKRA